MVVFIYLQNEYVETAFELTNCFLDSTVVVGVSGRRCEGWVPGHFIIAGPNFVA